MKLELAPRLQRWIAIGLLLLVVVVLLNVIVVPVWSSSALHGERVDMLRRQALTMEGLADAAPRYEAAAKKLAANAHTQLLTFAAPQPTLAVAQLQGQLSQLTASASAVVTSSQALPEVREGALTKVTVQTMLEADVKALIKVLHGIDAARPLLKIEKLVIRDPDGDWSVVPPAAEPNKLQVEIVVSAYMRVP
ncbi:MAG: type II secretion system protein M [Alphaproteobacteria bacterium]|nr:type II secretion system protein M [Alphaproteobacteria bacterium]